MQASSPGLSKLKQGRSVGALIRPSSRPPATLANETAVAHHVADARWKRELAGSIDTHLTYQPTGRNEVIIGVIRPAARRVVQSVEVPHFVSDIQDVRRTERHIVPA